MTEQYGILEPYSSRVSFMLNYVGQWRLPMFDLSTPESTLVVINAIALTLTQAIKTLAGLLYGYVLAIKIPLYSQGICRTNTGTDSTPRT